MNDRPEPEQVPVAAGRCASCRHARLIRSDRGSRFVLCERSKTDPAFPRFPPLPVVACRGHESERPT